MAFLHTKPSNDSHFNRLPNQCSPSFDDKRWQAIQYCSSSIRNAVHKRLLSLHGSATYRAQQQNSGHLFLFIFIIYQYAINALAFRIHEEHIGLLVFDYHRHWKRINLESIKIKMRVSSQDPRQYSYSLVYKYILLFLPHIFCDFPK